VTTKADTSMYSQISATESHCLSMSTMILSMSHRLWEERPGSKRLDHAGGIPRKYLQRFSRSGILNASWTIATAWVASHKPLGAKWAKSQKGIAR